MEIWVVSTFWLLWIILLWTCVRKSLLSVPLGIYPVVGLLNHMVILWLAFWGNAIPFSTAAAPFCIPISGAQGFQLIHILANTCYFPFFFIITILVSVFWFAFPQWLVTLGIFTHVCWPFVFLLWRNIFKFIAHFLIGLFLLLSNKARSIRC